MRGARFRLLVAVVGCATATLACTGDGGLGERRPHRAAAVQPGDVSGTAAPFHLALDRIIVVGMDNGEILGVAGTPASNEAAELAVTAARRALLAFLNAQLVDEDTRFTAAPIDRLLSSRARRVVSADDRTALGEVALPIERTITGPASTVAQVLVHGEIAHAVTLSYNALLTVELEGGSQSPVKQSGTMTFIPTAEGWRADAVEVTTELPETAP